ncbi:MAG: hypothetical protein JO284_06650 [Planctomycetaceae bacterium]|nr:hypothetical protein [Planctomycetaceae bacterium]MBV8314064.1 hypothetical protein [Planctomycetaceae bacterium]
MSAPGGPIWMVPRRPDPDFVGRSDELAALGRALAVSGRSALMQPASVHGLGGVGKTLLAVELAHRHAEVRLVSSERWDPAGIAGRIVPGTLRRLSDARSARRGRVADPGESHPPGPRSRRG